jgi:lipopolysaccharide heptosyltransferase I
MNVATLRDKSFERVLLIKPSAVGDVIHTLPVLAKLRARYPNARIDWLLTPAIAELVGRHPALSGVVLFDRHRYRDFWRDWSATSGLVGLFQALREPRYDLVVDLHGQFRSAVLALATGAPVRIGFDRPRKSSRGPRELPESAYRHGWTGAREGAWLAYTHRIGLPTLDMHAVDRYLLLGGMLGFDDGPPDFHVPVPEAAEEYVTRLLAANGLSRRSLAVLVPGTRWETKNWHADGFAGVARYVRGTGRAVVLAGSSAERPRCRDVAERFPGVCDLSGQTTLSELAALLRRADLCVTNDSGSMHLAVALGRPVVSVFGPTEPVWVGPYGRPDAVVRAEVPCAPCYLRQLRRCPNGHMCMTGVGPELVIDRIKRELSRPAA